MRGYPVLGLLLLALSAHAGDTLRVGSQVLSTGDSSARVVELLGKPTAKARATTSGRAGRGRRKQRRVAGAVPGEQWQYRRGRRTTVITIVDGRISRIDER